MAAGQLVTLEQGTYFDLRNYQSEDRRMRQRFPLSLDVEYSIRTEDSVVSGHGRTLDLSSRGLRFTTEKPLPIGPAINVAIEWPQTLTDGVPLRLVLAVEVMRRSGAEMAARIYQYEFRTRRSR